MSNKFIPYGCQDIDDDDINNVVKVLKSDFIRLLYLIISSFFNNDLYQTLMSSFVELTSKS